MRIVREGSNLAGEGVERWGGWGCAVGTHGRMEEEESECGGELF